MKRIIRVFPSRTSYTPDDPLAFVGMPPFPCMIPEHDEVHISCAFTWDKDYAEQLAEAWSGATNKPVKLGGVAYKSPVEDFIPGMYVKKNVVFTTRGCNNRCPWCMVWRDEGPFREQTIYPGNIIQDNNILQASRQHKDKVFEMLKTQKAICFKGGLEPDLLDDHFISGLQDLRIKELWLACDTDARFPYFQKACEKLTKAGFNRNKINCYVLSYGKDRDADEARDRKVYEAGAMPFVQLYRDFSEKKTEYSSDWNAWQRMWSRPAAIRAHMERNTDYRDFNT